VLDTEDAGAELGATEEPGVELASTELAAMELGTTEEAGVELASTELAAMELEATLPGAEDFFPLPPPPPPPQATRLITMAANTPCWKYLFLYIKAP